MTATTRPFGIEIEAFGIARETARLALSAANLRVQPSYADAYT